MIFTSSTVREELDLVVDGNRVEQVDSFTYLGVELFANANWRRTQLKLAEQGKKAIYLMKSMQRRHHQNVMDKLYDFETLVEPVITYG